MAAWSLDAVAAAGIPRAVVAVPPGHGAVAEEALGGAAGDFPLGLAFVEGGAVRSASVRNALAAVGDADAVAVHDAARPLADAGLFTRTLAALADADAAIAAARVTDTIKEAGPDGRRRRAPTTAPACGRSRRRRRSARRSCGARSTSPDAVLAAATDDAWLVERAGGTVRVVESPPANLKVTTPHDLALAESLLC